MKKFRIRSPGLFSRQFCACFEPLYPPVPPPPTHFSLNMPPLKICSFFSYHVDMRQLLRMFSSKLHKPWNPQSPGLFSRQFCACFERWRVVFSDTRISRSVSLFHWCPNTKLSHPSKILWCPFKKESKTMKYNCFAILGIFFENLGYFEKCTKCSTVSPMPQYEAVTPYQKKFLARHSALIIFCTWHIKFAKLRPP